MMDLGDVKDGSLSMVVQSTGVLMKCANTAFIARGTLANAISLISTKLTVNAGGILWIILQKT